MKKRYIILILLCIAPQKTDSHPVFIAGCIVFFAGIVAVAYKKRYSIAGRIVKQKVRKSVASLIGKGVIAEKVGDFIGATVEKVGPATGTLDVALK